ncbi:protein kinase domain-containing protein [Nocardiopsis algeriensis]|uniref:serine/threonine-protein kinase n=1 Tax=Nocardiopsis algeriensis TaxID=1478215 RepID=UPI003B4361DA
MSSPSRSSVGRYELREQLGAGGMGAVWHAWDPALERDVAVKEVSLPEQMSEEERAQARERTLREARATARIRHGSVVTVHDVFEHEGTPWIVMELLSGSSLRDRVQDGPLSEEEVERIARALLGGLSAAHGAGVTHRDVKPANVMATEDGRIVLTDFGIADMDGTTALTKTGVYVGSPEYMAPERFDGERALPASDLWSLGVTLCLLLEGRSPFKRSTVTGTVNAVLAGPVPPRLSVPEGSPLRELIGALLTRDVSARPTADEALEILERAVERRGSVSDVREAAALPPGDPAPGASASALPPAPLPGTPASGTPAPAGPHPSHAAPGGAHTEHGGPAFAPPGSPAPLTAAPAGGGVSPAAAPQGIPAPGVPAFNGPHTAYGAPGGPHTAYDASVPPGAWAHGRDASAALPPGAAGRVDRAHRAGRPTSPRNSRPAGRMPLPVTAAVVMLGANALYVVVLVALFTAEALGSGEGWGSVAVLGGWGLFSAFAASCMATRSRLLYGAVVLVQLLVSVMLVLDMFVMLVHAPAQLPFYAAILLFQLVLGGLLTVPRRARAYFGLG